MTQRRYDLTHHRAFPQNLWTTTRSGSTAGSPSVSLVSPKSSAFKLALSLAVGPNDITQLFVAKYGVPAAGAEICLHLVPTSQAGLRHGALLVTGFCTGVSAVQTGTDDSEADTLLQAA